MIRRAHEKDLPEIKDLLSQVLKVHEQGRPDIFIAGTRKYRDEEIIDIINDDSRPLFVYTDGEDTAVAYAFCIFEETKGMNSLHDMKTLYIDDICVDKNHRRQGIAQSLFEFVKKFAKENDCYRITLNVWELNPGAKRFYESMGMLPLKTVMETVL